MCLNVKITHKLSHKKPSGKKPSSVGTKTVQESLWKDVLATHFML